MKINAVIGNPPYNNDMYIPFVEMGHQLATDCSLFITPAKWQAKGGKDNEAFRQNIVPHMRKIVYYPCTKDVFDKVAEAGGISYYLVDKQTHDDKYIKISCSMQPLFNSNGFEHNRADMMLNKICTSIVDKCNSTRSQFGKTLAFHQSYYIQNTDSGNKNKTHKDDVEVFGGKAGGEVDDTGNKFFFLGYKPYNELKRNDNIDKYKVCISCMTGGTSFFGLFNMDGTAIGLTPASVIGPNQVNKGSYYCLRTFDTLDEAKSLQSYLNCRLIRFLVRCSVVGTTLTEEFFRFVPDPGAFDHIFTDEELYKKYNLTDEEIEIIESVIKERK